MVIILFAGFVALGLNIYLKRHDIPPIIGYIATGMILTAVFNVEGDSHALAEIAEMGIVFLMFTIGLELPIRQLAGMKQEVLINGGLQVTVSTLLFSAIAYYGFGLSGQTSIVIGAALALSSTAIVLKILNENHDIAKPYGRKTLGILLFQDIAVIPIILMISLMANADQSVGSLVLTTVLEAGALLILMYLLGKYVLDKALNIVSKTHSHEIFILSILLITVGTSYLAHAFGFSYSLGAFIGGMLIAETHYKHQVEADLVPFRDILLGVFFVTVGMQIQIVPMLTNLHIIVLLMVVIMAIKLVLIFGIVNVVSERKIALKTALALSQVGEFSFVVFEEGLRNNLIPEHIAQTMIPAVVLSMVLTPFILKNITRISTTLLRTKVDIASHRTFKPAKIEGHIIVCGYSELGQRVVAQLKKQDIPYLGIENDPMLYQKALKDEEAVMFGNPAQKAILKHAQIQNAAAIIIATHDTQKIQMITHSISDIDNSANVIVKVPNREEFAKLEDLPVDHVIDENEVISEMLVRHALACEISR